MCPAHGAREEARWSATTPGRSSRAGSSAGSPSAPSRRRTRSARRTATCPAPTCSRCCRTRRASCTWGTSRTTRSATRSAISAGAHGLARAAPDGLRRVRPAGRERRDPRGPAPARRHERQHRRDPQADEAHGLVDRLVARALDGRARVLPLDAVDLPAAVRARPRLQARVAGQLVPGRPDGARQRAGHRRPLRALRLARRERACWRSGTSRSPTTRSGCSTTWRCSRTGPSAC